MHTWVQCTLKCPPTRHSQEVETDLRRVFATGWFSSCVPDAEDTRDGVKLIIKVRGRRGGEGACGVWRPYVKSALRCAGRHAAQHWARWAQPPRPS